MTAKCPLCTATFRNKKDRSAHMTYCDMLELYRGKTYVFIRRKDGEITDLIHINRDARLYSHRTKKVMYDYPEELEIIGGFRIYSDGSGFKTCWRVVGLMALDRILGGHNDYFHGREATEEDMDIAKDRLLMRFDRLVIL